MSDIEVLKGFEGLTITDFPLNPKPRLNAPELGIWVYRASEEEEWAIEPWRLDAVKRALAHPILKDVVPDDLNPLGLCFPILGEFTTGGSSFILKDGRKCSFRWRVETATDTVTHANPTVGEGEIEITYRGPVLKVKIY